MNAKFAELLALAADVTWSASFSDRQNSVNVFARSGRLPGTDGLYIDLLSPAVWRVRPSSCTLQLEEAAFWRRFSDQDVDPFAGFELTTTDLAAVLPADQLATVLDGLRSIAARREASALQDAAKARNCRAVVQQYDRNWACPVRTGTAQFEDPGHRLRVEHLLEPGDWRPARCWVLREIDPYVRDWLLPGWWATRRGADDEARRVLASKAARTAKGTER